MGRLPSLSRLSSADLHRELRRRERGVHKLERKRAALAAKIDDIDALIMRMGGTSQARPGRGGGTRASNEMTLAEALAKAIHGKTMGVSEAAEAVQKAGYRTNSANFRTQVNIALIKSGKFKRVGRGQYTAK